MYTTKSTNRSIDTGLSDGHYTFLFAIHAHINLISRLHALLTLDTTHRLRQCVVPCTHVIAPRLKLNRHVRKSLHDLRQTSPHFLNVSMTSTKYTWLGFTWHVMPSPGVPCVFRRRRLCTERMTLIATIKASTD